MKKTKGQFMLDLDDEKTLVFEVEGNKSMSKENIRKRIKQVLQEQRITTAWLAREIGIKPQAARTWIKQNHLGKYTYPSPKNLLKLSKITGYDPKWFYLDDIESSKFTKGDQVRPKGSGYSFHLLDVEASAGNGIINNDFHNVLRSVTINSEFLPEFLPYLRNNLDKVYLITVPTDSMSPTIEKGDIVFIDTSVTSYEGEGVYVFVDNDNMLYIKRLQLSTKSLLIISDNKHYQTIEVSPRDTYNYRILGRLVKRMSLDMIDL